MIQSGNTSLHSINDIELQKFINRVNDFDTIVDCLGIDRSLFYSSLDPLSEFFISNAMDIPVCLWAHDINSTVLYGNKLFTEKFGKCLGKPCYECLMAEGDHCDCCQTKKLIDQDEFQKCTLCKRKDIGYDINVCHTSIRNKHGNRIFLKTSFHVDDAKDIFDKFYAGKQRNASKEFLLTICSACNKTKVRSDKWVHIDEHVLHCFTDTISHGICPECVESLYPDLIVFLKVDNHRTDP